MLLCTLSGVVQKALTGMNLHLMYIHALPQRLQDCQATRKNTRSDIAENVATPWHAATDKLQRRSTLRTNKHVVFSYDRCTWDTVCGVSTYD